MPLILCPRQAPHLPYPTASPPAVGVPPGSLSRRAPVSTQAVGESSSRKTCYQGEWCPEGISRHRTLLLSQQISPSRTNKTLLLNPKMKGQFPAVALDPRSQSLVCHLISQASKLQCPPVFTGHNKEGYFLGLL